MVYCFLRLGPLRFRPRQPANHLVQDFIQPYSNKGPVKLIQRVKIAHSFLQSVSNQFHFIILSSPM